MSSSAVTGPRPGFEIWVARALADAETDPRGAAELARKARFLRGLLPRLTAKPAIASLKGIGADDLVGWAARLEKGARA